MPKVALLGANSQVGAEVAAYLAGEPDVELVGLVRSEYSAVLLRVLGIPYRAVDFADPAGMRAALGDCDLVADFTYASGPVTEILQKIRRNTEAAVGAMRPGGRFVQMSSLMALGMANEAEHVRASRVPRTSYGYIKRRAEDMARRLGRAHGVEVYLLRLGHVHGILQVVTQDFVDRLSVPEEVLSTGGPGEPTTTVFAYSVARALLHCIRGTRPPGLYSIVSSPQWTLEELYAYYRRQHGVPARVRYVGGRREHATVRGAVRRMAAGRVQGLRGVLESYVLLRAPGLFARVKGPYRERAVRSTVGTLEEASGPLLRHMLGRVPETMTDIGSAPDEVSAAERELQARIERAVAEARR